MSCVVAAILGTLAVLALICISAYLFVKVWNVEEKVKEAERINQPHTASMGNSSVDLENEGNKEDNPTFNPVGSGTVGDQTIPVVVGVIVDPPPGSTGKDKADLLDSPRHL